MNKEIADEYASKFKGRFLTKKSYEKLNERDKEFHLFGHWNILHDDGENLIHSYMNGATGEKEKEYNKLSFSDIGKTIFIPYEKSFIVFKKCNKTGGLKGIYLNPVIGRKEPITEREIFLQKHGINVQRETMRFDKNMLLKFGVEDVFKKA